MDKWESGDFQYGSELVNLFAGKTQVVTAANGKKTGASTVNQFDEKSLKRAVETAEELARLAPENEEYMPRLGLQEYLDGHGYFDSTAAITPEFRAEAAAGSIGPSRDQGLTAAGFLNDSNKFQAMANTKGLFAYYNWTGVSFFTTIRTVDPQTQLYTGLTRDGTFFVEDGEIKYPVKNLRFNESPIIMLNNLEKLGRPQRLVIEGGASVMAPPMVIREFTFSSQSDAM